MKVDFNNVRRKAIIAHNHLVHLLNDQLDESGKVCVSREDLEKPLEQLRNALVVIALTHVEGDPEFQDVLGDCVVPEFAPEEDEDDDS